MAVVEELTGFTTGTSQNQTAKNGVKFTMSSGRILTQIKKFSTCGATKAYILDSSKSVLATATFSGDTATFSYTVANSTTYYAAVDKDGASYDRRYNAGQSYPIGGTHLDYITGLSNGNDVSSEVNSLTSVSTDVDPNVTITPSTFTLTLTGEAATPIIIPVVTGALALTLTLMMPTVKVKKDGAQGTVSTRTISKNWPGTSGTTTNTKHAGRQINLVAEGIHGIKTTVYKKQKEGLNG